MKIPEIAAFEKRNFKNTNPLPEFKAGDTVRVHYKIEEGQGDKKSFRIQEYEGVVIRRKKGTVDATFTVRKISANSVDIERVFPDCSQFIDKVDVVAHGIVKRSRLYYLRNLSGKAARIRSKFIHKPKATKTKAK